MNLVVDANIIFSTLISDGFTRNLLLLSSDSLYIPEFVFDEVLKYTDLLEKKAGLSKEEVESLLRELISAASIKVVPLADIREFSEMALEISPDPNDAHYFALALKLNCAIWSNDKALKRQNAVRVYSTSDLARLFGGNGDIRSG